MPRAASPEMWKFSIDVGGTFTDCLGVSPDGLEQRCLKILSSGVTKGPIGQWDGQRAFRDAARREVDEFWTGAVVHLVNCDGERVWNSPVTACRQSSGELIPAEPVPEEFREAAVGYELTTAAHAPILAIHLMLAIPLADPLPACRLHLGTTRGTNALLTRSGARTALVTTRGFADLLSIGDQTRPDLFALNVRKPPPLCEATRGLNERVLVDGTIETPLDADDVRHALRELRDQGIESLAVCLMHGYKYPDHERAIGAIARECGWEEVCLSCDTAPLVKILNRAETTVLDAWLNPVLRGWLNEIESQLAPASRTWYMTSAGGLVSRERFSGRDSLLSGPAAGVVGAADVARRNGFARAITLDMGGTSTDVSRFDGGFELEYESTRAGVRVMTPVMAIETVAAGGGSICRFDGTRIVVGPESAGADPGPACYGRGGPLTISDVNLLLGRVCREQFPFPLRIEAAQRRLRELRSEMSAAGFELSDDALAKGCVDVANHHMAEAIRNVSIVKGYDVREFPLVAFGGAAAQHCCAIARLLDIRTILIDSRASILSSAGLHLAGRTSHAVESILRPIDDDVHRWLPPVFEELRKRAVEDLVHEGATVDADAVRIQLSLEVRYAGTEPCETIEYEPGMDLNDAYHKLHQLRYGYVQNRAIEIVTARVAASCPGGRTVTAEESTPDTGRSQPDIRSAEGSTLRLDALEPGTRVAGPAIVADAMTTTVVQPGWVCTVGSDGSLRLDDCCFGEAPLIDASDSRRDEDDEVDPVQLEIFNRHFVSIATQMGSVLQRTSSSVNVRERMDFSCALFTRTGDLVVNAPHIPVHLGAMSETVREIIALNPEIRMGDAFVTNDPYAGGSHLPDVTVITPVFAGDGGAPDFWVASRAHHAEIGGIAPGSMPASATRLADEGVLIGNFKLIDGGKDRFGELRALLAGGFAPSRTPDENIRDIRAQLAANRCGELALRDLVARHSIERVGRYMRHIQDAAETLIRTRLLALDQRECRFSDQMDSGQRICLGIRFHDGGVVFDFAGTDAVAANNLNANRAIVSSAIMYVMRMLAGRDIPLSEGMMKPVELILPDCFLNARPAPVRAESPPIVGGNVETSQRVVDVILGALGMAAASQGTMNNWLMGDGSFGYYETVGGGSGGTPDAAGGSAVHCHMSNTRLSDPEILECRYPVIVRELAIRRGSGGDGAHRGGDGMIRHIEFRSSLTLSLLTSRRRTRPYGMAGGGPGAAGVNLLIRSDGRRELLADRTEVVVEPGDSLRLLTPGGGGWGKRPG